MKIGSAYYPEFWPRERWETDARMMKETGFNTVRLAEFAWAAIEPSDGQFDWQWLDEAVELFTRYDIGVVLSTPTPTPPKWLCDLHDIYPRDENRQTRGFGSRRHVCANNPHYLERCNDISRRIAERYGQHPGVIAWQLDNEYGVHGTIRCYCDHCRAAFHRWLHERYGTAEALNKAWGTAFWSQRYSCIEEIELPGYTTLSNECAYPHNPSLTLDFFRFSSDSFLRFGIQQKALVAQYSDRPITTNMMGLFDQMDYYKLGRELDFICWDNYPPVKTSRYGNYVTDMAHDAMCAVGDGSFWVMEQQSGPNGWNTLSQAPRPGQLRYWAEQAVAHGANGIIYFNWRPCLSGTEMNWHGVLDHDGKDGGRRKQELAETSAALHKLAPVLAQSRILRSVALVRSYDNIWSSQIQPQNASLTNHQLQYHYYAGFRNADAHPAFVDLGADPAGYDMVVLPAQYLITPAQAALYQAYVESGGTLIVTYNTGIKEWDNRMSAHTPPGLLTELCGVSVVECDSLPADDSVPLFLPDGPELTATSWCEILRPAGAQPIAYYAGAYYSGQPAATVHKVGRGQVFYIGFALDEPDTHTLVAWLCKQAGLPPSLVRRQPEIELVTRITPQGRRLFTLLNSSAEPRQAVLRVPCTDLLTGCSQDGALCLAPYQCCWLLEDEQPKPI